MSLKKAVTKKGKKLFVNPKDLLISTVAVQETLKVVNSVRKVYGKKPIKTLPPGIPGDGCNCPVFNALEGCEVDSVDGDINFKKSSRLNALLNGKIENRLVTEFVSQFDSEGEIAINAYREEN